MNTYTVSFFGHRRLDNSLLVETELEGIIADLILRHEYVEFLVGRDGDFDLLVASIVRRCKRNIRNDNSSLIWVMPYLKSEFIHDEDAFRNYYDEIEVCEESSAVHYKAAFQTRNKAIVDRSDLIVFCVNRKGGAYQTMHYAIRQKKHIRNIDVGVR